MTVAGYDINSIVLVYGIRYTVQVGWNMEYGITVMIADNAPPPQHAQKV